MSTEQRNREMAELYARWQREEANLHPNDRSRKGYAALAQVFGVSIHVARHAVAYGSRP